MRVRVSSPLCVAWLLGVSLLQCTDGQGPEPERRVLGTDTEPSSIAVSVADLTDLGVFDARSGSLTWTGGTGAFAATPASGQSGVEQTLARGDGPVLDVDPCPFGPPESTPASATLVESYCRRYMQIPVVMTLSTDDGGLDVSISGKLKVYAPRSWEMLAESREVQGGLVVDPAGASEADAPVFLYFLEAGDGCIEGSLSVSVYRQDGPATATASGAVLARWSFNFDGCCHNLAQPAPLLHSTAAYTPANP